MNLLKRQVIIAIAASILIFFMLGVSFFLAFPISDWSLIWKQKLADIPFIIFAAGISLGAGLFFGIMSGLPIKKQLGQLEELLRKIALGQPIEMQKEWNLKELDEISFHIKKIQNLLVEQTKLTQKLANENVKEQEKRVEQMVSQERQRLARELHDSVSQHLFAASMLISAVKEDFANLNENKIKQIRLVEEIIHQSQLEMRALLLHLRPVPLKGKSLQEGMEELLNELRQKVPLNIQWKIEDFFLEKGIEDHLFRILQESVSNTLRHAKATTLEVLLIKRNHLAILRIVDDGIGFDVETTKTGSYGLQNMFERAAEIGGTLQIVSMPNQGTRLEVKVPLLLNEGENDD